MRLRVWTAGAAIVVGLGLTASLASGMTSPVVSGRPGCLKLLLERPMAERFASKMHPHCRDLRETYLNSMRWYAESPEQFQKKLKSSFQTQHPNGSAYAAILMTALFHESKLIPELKKLSKTDPYAQAALEKIRDQKCSSRFSSLDYDEICRIRSPSVDRLVAISVAEAKRKPK